MTTFSQQKQSDGYTSAIPAPSPEELRKFYADFYYQAPQSSSYQESYDEAELAYKGLKCDSLVYAFGQNGIKQGTFLDIGAGEGFLMNAARQAGFSVNGLDFSSFGVAKFFPELSERLIAGDVYESLAQLASEGKTFDVCSAINVLEHVIDPALFLKSIRKVVAPGGLLAITVPNDFSDLHQLLLKSGMIDREFWFVPPHHLHYFNSDNLIKVFETSNFEVIDAFSDFPIDLYLLHGGSNYITDASNGPAAHRARIMYDLLISKRGMPTYLDFYRAMFKVGVGRNITAVLRPI